MTASDKHSIVTDKGPPPSPPQLTSLNSYQIRNCLNIRRIFDILNNETPRGVASLCQEYVVINLNRKRWVDRASCFLKVKQEITGRGCQNHAICRKAHQC